jgi:CheY-like chemotaxis protein
MIVEESQHSEFNETEDLVSSGIYAKCGVIERCPDEDQSSKMYMLLEFQGAALGVDVPFDLTLEAFEAFHQSIDDNAEASLYCLAKRLEALRGNYGVSVRKDDKTGCVLWFMIPYLPDTSYCSPRLERLSSLSHKSSELKRTQFKLLIICDEYSLLLTSRDSLLENGYISEYVDNGPDALKMTVDQSVAGTPYDAVLLDLDIPMKGNINYVRRLRQSEKARTDNLIPQLVIGVSQSMEYRETADALHSGVNAFASHPISCDYLYDIINTFRSSLSSTKRDKNSNSQFSKVSFF